jgi:hypothetical protein
MYCIIPQKLEAWCNHSLGIVKVTHLKAHFLLLPNGSTEKEFPFSSGSHNIYDASLHVVIHHQDPSPSTLLKIGIHTLQK